MPKFFLNIHKDGQTVKDEEGVDFPDIESAVEEAMAAAREIIAENIKRNEAPCIGHAFEIIDSRGAVLRTLPFSDSLHPDFGAVRR
ncbi:DUF6894 family protein [Aureimonas glaciei]|uniref:DUF6894 domain-containing protein n=1 Tax=Aureimonas glaciei TaxID=1776957 RepID=A0A916XZI8_9HYPH|nr:hypothetical protein [Aureimonas glaciei]GGD24280.1 hypothetical protein GCM10011335_29010 [Aureimonas glaciei]